MSFWFYINKKPVDKANSLEEAKKLAESYINDKQPLTIENLGAPEKNQLPLQKIIWKYDYDKSIWVEEVVHLIVCGG
jgi:hypothetical protein